MRNMATTSKSTEMKKKISLISTIRDSKGNITKDPKTLETEEKKQDFSQWHNTALANKRPSRHLNSPDYERH